MSNSRALECLLYRIFKFFLYLPSLSSVCLLSLSVLDGSFSFTSRYLSLSEFISHSFSFASPLLCKKQSIATKILTDSSSLLFPPSSSLHPSNDSAALENFKKKQEKERIIPLSHLLLDKLAVHMSGKGSEFRRLVLSLSLFHSLSHFLSHFLSLLTLSHSLRTFFLLPSFPRFLFPSSLILRSSFFSLSSRQRSSNW